MKKIITFITLILLNMTNLQAKNIDPKNILIIETKYGKTEFELLPNLAPNHVKRIKTLANEGFYDGVVFHRVIDGFMAQTGDPTGTGTGGSNLPDLKSEFTEEPHLRGVLSMARAMNPHSANSQFFIMLDNSPHLDNQYSVFGRVIKGMEFIDQIKKGDADNGMVSKPDAMIKVRTLK
tara:strand:- start:11 stop:544 length:534 start_codon:yes stop_codon:yes gene_type:complete